MGMQPGGGTVSYIVAATIVAVVLFVRMRRLRSIQRLRLERLWVVPAIYGLLAAIILYQSPPAATQWPYLGLGLLVGGAIGWHRGKLMRISIDPATHELNQQASPAALLFILILVMIRTGLRLEAARLGFDAALLTDLLVISACGLFAATRLEMFLRARRLLSEVRGGSLGTAG